MLLVKHATDCACHPGGSPPSDLQQETFADPVQKDTDNGNKTDDSYYIKDMKEDPGDDLELQDLDYFPDLGTETIAQKEKDLDAIFNNAVKKGLQKNLHERVKNMLKRYRPIFRSKLSPAQPAKVAPMVIEKKVGVKPFKTAPRSYPIETENYLREYLPTLARWGLLEERNRSEWGSALVVVPKGKMNGVARFRVTSDQRGANHRQKEFKYKMPDVDTELLKFRRAKYFASLDLSDFYWTLPLEGRDKEMLCICLLYTSPSPRDLSTSRMPSSA